MSEASWDRINNELPLWIRYQSGTSLHNMIRTTFDVSGFYPSFYPKYVYKNVELVDGQATQMFRFGRSDEENISLARQLLTKSATPMWVVIRIMRLFYAENPTMGIHPNAPPEFNPDTPWLRDEDVPDYVRSSGQQYLDY